MYTSDTSNIRYVYTYEFILEAIGISFLTGDRNAYYFNADWFL